MSLKQIKVQQFLWHRPRKARKYLWKIRKAKYARGFGIHSPFVYSLITKVLREKNLYYDYNKIEQLRDALLNDSFLLKDRDTRRIVTKFKTSERHGRFLFRLVNFFHPETLLEIGTGLGVDTLYMASPHADCRCVTLEEDQSLHLLSKMLFSRNCTSNIEAMKGSWEETVKQAITTIEKLDFVCLNAGPQLPIREIYNICRTKMHDQSIFLIRNIRTSIVLFELWEELKKEKNVVTSVDMYSMGILFYNPSLTNQQYNLYY